jgi:7-cyano-7-deazaguanine synthase in queuosine biosynthesis
VTAYRFHFSETPAPRDVAPGHVVVSDADLAEPPFRLEDLAPSAGSPSTGPPPLWAQDLLLVARAAHIADRMAARGAGADRWSRTIELSVPVLDLRRWTALAQHRLALLLQTLTADEWRLTLRPSRRFARGAQAALDGWRAGEVCLYSGAPDSAAYLAVRAAEEGDGPLLPVMFVDGSLKGAQLEVLSRAVRGARREVRLLTASHTPLGVHEATSRSRGLLFAAFGVYAAAAHGCRTLAVPANGLVAVNPPLSPGRVAAASTRAVHPRTLDLLNAVIAAIGGEVTVGNPWIQGTPGEVLAAAVAAGLTPDDLALTTGCARPPAKRGRRHQHCGRCHPCLVRRAAFRVVLGHDATGYETDLATLSPDSDAALDLRALLGWLRAPFTAADVVADLPLPAGVAAGDLVAVVGRARWELSSGLAELAPAAAGPEGWSATRSG